MKDIFLLDMDDTLLDFLKLQKLCIGETLSSLGLDCSDGVCERFRQINDGLWKALERGEIKRERIVTVRFEMLFGEYGFRADTAQAADSFFRRMQDNCFPFAGAIDFLKTLKRAGRVYILTNGAAVVQRRHLADSGIGNHIDGAFVSDDVGANKPSAEYCRYVAEHIPDFRRERAVYVGDSLTADLPCANTLGVEFIRFQPADRSNTADEYRKILAKIAAM